jgi:hypothetical protein
MRTKLKYGITIAVCALLLGCSTLFTSVVTVTEVVDSAMKNWAQASKARQTTPEFNTQVIKLHDNYRLAAAAAQLSLKTYKNTNNASDLVAALAAAKDGAIPLVDFIVQILSAPVAAELQANLSKATTP